MKEFVIAFVATAAFVFVASADDAWFTGTIGSEANGSWTMGTEGISTNNTTLLLDNASASFKATTEKAADDSQNLKFATSAKFSYSYDVLPAVDPDAKAGIVVFNNVYYVLAKDGTSNKWVTTGVSATLDAAVDVNVTITNGTDGAHALYTIGDSTFDKLVVVPEESDWGTVGYSGSGEVASLVGTTIPLVEPVYQIPGGKVIAKSIADPWAAAQLIPADKIAEVLVSEVKYNGRTAAESCLLGVATNADLKATIVDNTAGKLGFELNCTPVANRVGLKVAKGASVVESEVSGTTVSVAVADGVYQVIAEVDDAQIPVSQEIGAKGTTVAAEKVAFIGAPWNDCPVTNLVKKTCCAANDMLEVYDGETDRWYTWTMVEGKWEYVATASEAEPELTIKKGQAVKYSSQAAGTVYTVGEVTTVASTAIIKGVNKWNLVACPIGVFKAAALPLDTTKAQAIVLGDDGANATKLYRKVNSQVYVRDGYDDVEWGAVGDSEVLNGGFFLKTENAESVIWAQE